MSTANKDGWIGWFGGECPVVGDALVDVMYKEDEEPDCGHPARKYNWHHIGSFQYDIIAYRLHKPAAQNPFELRDRIREIDDSIKSTEDEFNEKMDALEEERVSLVQRLEDEGFRLIGKVNEKLDSKDANLADMTDWRNWKAGDLVVCIDTQVPENEFTPGSQYIIDYMEKRWCNVVEDDEGDDNALPHESFKWHSRPSASK